MTLTLIGAKVEQQDRDLACVIVGSCALDDRVMPSDVTLEMVREAADTMAEALALIRAAGFNVVKAPPRPIWLNDAPAWLNNTPGCGNNDVVGRGGYG